MILHPIEYGEAGQIIASRVACFHRRVLRAMFAGDVGAFTQWLAETTLGGYSARLDAGLRRVLYRVGDRAFELQGGNWSPPRAVEIR